MLSLTILNKSSDGRIKYNFFKNDGTMVNYILFDVLKLITILIILKLMSHNLSLARFNKLLILK